MKPEQARTFVLKTRRIQGWFSPEAAMLFAWIDEIQRSNRLTGDILEIGVHHGKSAVFLGALLDSAREKLTVCDLFLEQDRNVSGSGSGNRHILEQNLKLYLEEGVDVRVFAKPSAELTTADTGTNHRFIHVDGGHTKEETLADLNFAARATLGAGVIAIDDPLALEWPGVAEALFHFLSGNRQFCGLAVGFNKLLLVGRDVASLYAREIDLPERRADYGLTYPWHYKQLAFMGAPLRIFHIPSFVAADSLRTRWIRYNHTHRWLQHPLLSPAVSLGKLLLRRNKP